MRVLVVESGTNFSALAEVRALGKAGWDVGVGSPRCQAAIRLRVATPRLGILFPRPLTIWGVLLRQ